MTDILYRHKIVEKGKGCVVLTDREFNNRIESDDLWSIDLSTLKDSGCETHYLDNNRICVITSVWNRVVD